MPEPNETKDVTQEKKDTDQVLTASGATEGATGGGTTDQDSGGEDYSWIDSIGTGSEDQGGGRVEPRYDPRLPEDYADPRYARGGYQQTREDPLDTDDPVALVKEFAKNPKRFIDALVQRRLEETVPPLMHGLHSVIRHTRETQFQQARETAINRLKEYARFDRSMADERLRKEVDESYSYFINNAYEGNPAAIRTLMNPQTPEMVVFAAKRKLGIPIDGLPQNRSAIRYSGGSLETGSTAGAQQSGEAPDYELALAERWGIPRAKAIENFRNFSRRG